MSNTYVVYISQRAFTSLIECVSFVKRLSPESAENLYREIMASIQSLSTFPKRNPEVDGLKIQNNPTRKMIIDGGRYIILYRIDGNQVIVYDVLDSRRDNKVISILL